MQRIQCVLALAGLVSLATAAHATTTSYYSCATATDTWCFVPGSDGQVSDGTTYSTGLGSISVYSETVTLPNNNYIGYGYAFSNPALNAMFAVNDTPSQDEGEGIAPFNPTEGGSPFTEQQGIADFSAYGYNFSNILLLQLGSNIQQGTTLNFLLQAGIGAQYDTVSDYWQDGGTSISARDKASARPT